jgi:uncharacterized protein YkwD
MRSLSVLAISGLLAALTAAQPPKSEKSKTTFQISESEAIMLEKANGERSKEKRPALKLNPLLMKAAREHSANMAKQEKLDHVLDEKGLDDRLKALGYIFRAAAENIAMGQQSPAETIASWMKSPPHKANLLSDQYTELGVGVVSDRRGRRYWTAVFAAPAPKP